MRHVLIIPHLVMQRQADFWGFLASQPSLLSVFWALGPLLENKQKQTNKISHLVTDGGDWLLVFSYAMGAHVTHT